jgi:hypothetical protein
MIELLVIQELVRIFRSAGYTTFPGACLNEPSYYSLIIEIFLVDVSAG